MAEDMIKVRIASPVKLGARWLKPGDQPEVTAGEEAELKAAGVLDLGPDTALPTSAGETVTVTVEQFQQAVAAQAKALSDAVTSAAIEGACAEMIKERETAAEGERNELKAQILHLEGTVADLSEQLSMAHENLAQLSGRKGTAPAEPAQTDTPPSEKAAKTAPKKGAAAATKG